MEVTELRWENIEFALSKKAFLYCCKYWPHEDLYNNDFQLFSWSELLNREMATNNPKKGMWDPLELLQVAILLPGDWLHAQ